MQTNKGMANNDRPFTQYDGETDSTQTDTALSADDRPIQNNGTENAHFSAGGLPNVTKVDYPLPRDPHAPGMPESKDAIDEYGLSTSETGPVKDQLQYGLEGEAKTTGGNESSIANYGLYGASEGKEKKSDTSD